MTITRRGKATSTAWCRFVALFLALIALERGAAFLGPATTTVRVLATVAMAISTLVAIALGIRMHQPQDRLTWRLLLADIACWLAGSVALGLGREVFHYDGYPGPADVFFFGQYAFLTAVFIRVVKVRLRIDRSADRAAALDAIAVVSAAALLSWRLVLGDVMSQPGPLSTRVALLAFPVMDLVVFGLAVRACVGRGSHTTPVKVCAAAAVILFSADTIFTWQSLRGSYTPHNWLEVPWDLCYLLVGAMALHPSMVQLTEVPEIRSVRFTTAQLLTLAGSTTLAPILLALNGIRDGHVDEIVIAVSAFVMLLAVITRAVLAARDDARAHDALVFKKEALNSALTALRVTEQERIELLASLIRVGEQERMWLAAELHDGPIQQLSALGFGIDRVRRRMSSGNLGEAAQSLEVTRDELTAVVSSLRKLMAELRPPALDQSGLEGALRDYLASFCHETAVDCAVDIRIGNRLPPEIETTLYRVAQEALHNVRRHAKASAVSVTLVERDGCVRMEVSDDGCGFDPGAVRSESVVNHYGLLGMRERVEQRGGTWHLVSGIGMGTSVCAEFPLLAYSTFDPDEKDETKRVEEAVR